MDTHQKALQVNLDPCLYGTFAEIGAGQEVARWFFRVGGAAGTIAKAMSAYDMTFSDAIYGTSDRYVSKQRIGAMLDHEFGLLGERLDAKRGDATRFFVFADTVAAKSYARKDDPHGWLGVRFQTAPRAPASQIIVHVRLLDKENVQEQEALGLIGVNLVHGANYLHHDPDALVASLLDNLTAERVEVDMIEFSGPDFAHVDNRLMSLRLVQNGLTHAAMFTAAGEVVQPADALYKKAILIERGSFRPATNVSMDMLRCAQAQFVQEPGMQGEDTITVMEMTLKNLIDADTIDAQDFLDRADILGALGKTVLISNYARVPPAGGLPLPPHQEDDRHRDGRADAARAVRREVLRRPRGRHSRVVRTALQERPQAVCLPAAGPEERIARDCRQPARRATPAAFVCVSRREPPRRERARLRRALPVGVLARRPEPPARG